VNLRLFSSVHAVSAALILGAFLYWRERTGAPLGRAPGLDPAFLLWTGWTAFALYLVLYAYALRKYAHKLRISPELGFKLPSRQERERGRAACEAALARLSRIRVRVQDGELRSARTVLREARQALKADGASRILKVRVRRGRTGRNGAAEPPFVLEVSNRQPIGRVAKWMHAHIFYGLAAAGVVYLHGGMTFTSPMAWLLNGLSLLVLGTGVIGIGFWAFGPAWLTRCEGDLSLEKAYALREHFARKISEAEKEVREGAPAEVQPKLADLAILRSQARCLETEWRARARVRFWINAWRLVHVPASIVLVAVLAVHVLSVWWY